MPTLGPSELQQVFLEDVPEAVLTDTLRCLLKTYADSARYCRDNFPWEEAHDLIAHHRRAQFEKTWRTRLSRYPGLDVSVKANGAGSSYHTEVRSGRVVMTASAVEAPWQVVRSAAFRQTLARDSQRRLFDDDQPQDEDAPLYAILLHGPLGVRNGLVRTPSFVHIAFPGADCEDYVGRFNLLDCFPALRAELETRPTVAVSRKQPKIRKQEQEQPG